MSMQRAAAFAPSNIALTKYWGKRDDTLNLPLASSVSITLSELGTLTVVAPEPDLEDDVMLVDERPLDDAGMVKVRRVLTEIRRLAGSNVKAGLRSVNTIPPARGLASSASAFAALALAASKAYGLDLDEAGLSRLARTGSGSAARSIGGGYVLWEKGEAPDGSDSFGRQVFTPEHWPLRILVAKVEDGRKKVSSTQGMKLSGAQGPLMQHWLQLCERDVPECLAALKAKDMHRLASVVEANALAMHGTMMATRPPLLYWQAATVAIIRAVQQMRHDGAECCFTIDAGSSVVVLSSAQDAKPVADTLSQIDGIEEVLQTRVGGGARLVGDGLPLQVAAHG